MNSFIFKNKHKNSFFPKEVIFHDRAVFADLEDCKFHWKEVEMVRTDSKHASRCFFLQSCKHKPCVGLVLEVKQIFFFCFCFTVFVLLSVYLFECVCSFLHHVVPYMQICIYQYYVLMHDTSSAYRYYWLIAFINIILSCIQFSSLFFL